MRQRERAADHGAPVGRGRRRDRRRDRPVDGDARATATGSRAATRALVAWIRGDARRRRDDLLGLLRRHADRGDRPARRAARRRCTGSPRRAFRRRHPDVVLRLEEALVVSGDGGRLVSSGAATAWHDLVLYLVARHVGPATAQALARFQLLQWHRDGQAAFQVFDPPTDHGDAAVAAAQRWIAANARSASPVEQMVEQSGLTARTFKRRFSAATGETPIAYVQRIRVERAKRRLETEQRPDRGDQLGGRLRGPGLVPPAVQAADRADRRRVPAPVPPARRGGAPAATRRTRARGPGRCGAWSRSRAASRPG